MENDVLKLKLKQMNKIAEKYGQREETVVNSMQHAQQQTILNLRSQQSFLKSKLKNILQDKMNTKTTMTDIYGIDKSIHAHGPKKNHAQGSTTIKRTCGGKLL